jgi:CelD/BcsL family acetyltransferase involved in cellulose biosynthesis
LAASHPDATVFHQTAWLRATARTFGYQPFILTTTPGNAPLQNGIALCRVSSWLTGTRVVSLPFADHCQPLLSDPGEYSALVDWLRRECKTRNYRYVEVRPLDEGSVENCGLQPARSYWFHELNLEPSLQQLFERLHKNSFQRNIRRAEREHLSYEAGRSQRLVDEFYRLLILTRRRHHVLPQPRNWFKNLVEGMSGNIEIGVARKNDTAVAAMVTLRHRKSIVYKYGSSDAALHHLGAVPFLFWRLIEEGHSSGAERIDFGRSDLDQEGLIAFKDRLGAQRKLITYYRYTNDSQKQQATPFQSERLRKFVSDMPDGFVSMASRMLYRHMG